jgi:diguanylate cyclase (GGDEF)-like protein
METKDDYFDVQAIARVTLETLKRLSREGKNLNMEELAVSLGASKELKMLTGHSPNADNFLKNEMLRLKKELGTLKTQYDKVDTKRRELAGQLDIAEGRNARHKTFIQQALPPLMQLARSRENPHLYKPLDHITDLLKNNAPTDELENALQSLKDVAFRAELDKVDGGTSDLKKSRIFNIFKRRGNSSQSDPVSHFKDAYTDIVEELRLNLDQAALDELAQITIRLSDVRQLDDFFPIRQKLLQLLKEYISRISTERKQAAAFIYEVGERLSEVEEQMLRSIAAAHESRNASARLTNTIEKEIDDFHETVDFTQTLEELKSRIIDKISAIKKVIESSRKEDISRNTQADSEVSILKKNLERMKGEIKSAKDRSESLEAELLTDPLTQAYNRRAYDHRIVDELKRYQRYKTQFSMLMLDVDHFKNINDQYGHSVGDLCLKEIINRIRLILRETDFLARYGGEEFVIILPETGKNGARKAAEKIRTHIEKTEFLHKGEQVKVTISLGGTEIRTKDKTAEDMFERVDNAMYQAKQSGRNRVVML